MDLEKSIVTNYGTFRIRPYVEEDERNVLDLWELVFGHKILPEILQWKFYANPFGRHIMLCVTEENLPVVMYSGVTYPANWSGANVLFNHLMDNMSHPGFRHITSGRKGLFVQTVEHYLDVYAGPQGSVVLYGFPGPRHFRLGLIFLDYQRSVQVKFLQMETARIKMTWPSLGGKVREISSANADFDSLWERASPFYPVSVKRSSRFLNWRFFQHPSNSYRVFSNYSITGKMTAYVVIAIAGKVASVVDVLMIPRQNGLKAIFRRIRMELLRLGVTGIQSWLPADHFVEKELKKLGFTDAGQEPFGIVPVAKVFNWNPKSDCTLGNLYYTMADGDLL